MTEAVKDLVLDPEIVNIPALRTNLLATVDKYLAANALYPGSLGPEVIDQLQKQYSGNGNTINYVTTLLEGSRDREYERLTRVEAELNDNLFTAICEHPLADAVGEYTYYNDWVGEPGQLRLRSHFGYLDEIVDRAVTNGSEQIPAFEIARNKQDQRILEIQTQVRNSEQPDRQLIKFSPSPTDITAPEVRHRGYQGNDQISIFEKTPDGKEKIMINWFPSLAAAEYKQLASELIALVPEDQVLNEQLSLVLTDQAADQPDTNIMAMSNRFSPAQIDHVLAFIKAQQAKMNRSKPDLQQRLTEQFYPKIRSTITPTVYQATLDLLSQVPEHQCRANFDQIFKLIEQTQFAVRLFIRDKVGLNTFIPSLSNTRLLKSLNFDQYSSLGDSDRSDLFNQVDYQASGCGFANQRNQTIPSFQLWGKSTILIAAGMAGFNPLNTELTLFVCPDCGKHHKIDVLNNEYIDFCDCGFDARCKDTLLN